jgi:hypothetical protein
VPVKETLAPSEGDAGARIQTALDKVSALPPDSNGLRGAVLLRKGEYKIAGVLNIKASGVVLRGEGGGEKETVLIATGAKQRTLISIGGGRLTEIKETRRPVSADAPCGTKIIQVDGAHEFKAGDNVIVVRPCTAEWVHALGMDRIPQRKDGGKVVQWGEGSEELHFDRLVTKAAGNSIHLDAPLTCALERKFGGGSIYKQDSSRRISHCGVENLRGVSEYNGPEDEDHGWTLIALSEIENAWVRGVTSLHFGNTCVAANSGAKWVTVEHCDCLDPISQITGGRRYSFAINGAQLVLVQNCHARNGRHDFVTGARVAGPSVFLDCSAEQAHADAGPHHRWAAGILYDNIKTDGELNVRNRGSMGSGHGWAGANHVFWNCAAKEIVCERPPTANNWAIGCICEKHEGDGTWESRGKHVLPRSLYAEQLAERKKLKP